MTSQRFVIIGGGLAAASAAEELRTHGFEGGIQILAGEPHHPYIRPPLSKEYFTGKDPRDSVYVHPLEWYGEHDIEVTGGDTVTAIGDHVVTLAERQVPFDRLLIATGARPRKLSLPGTGLPGIHYLRTIEDSEALRDEVKDGGRRVVVVGSGWIGLELAAAARGYGNSVTVVAPGRIPLSSALGDELGTMFRELHEQNGVEFRLGANVTGFEGEAGRVSGVLVEGARIGADVVVVGVGASPNSELAEAAGLETADEKGGGGILVDEHLATSTADIFAAGDVANAYHPVIKQRMRNEHWANALASGKVAGASMMGADASFDDIPYFYTDQFDLGMEYSGYPPLTKDAEVVYRGNRAGREFIAFWLAGDRVVAGMNVNVWDVNEDVQKLIRSEKPVDRARLTDPQVPLAEVLAAGA